MSFGPSSSKRTRAVGMLAMAGALAFGAVACSSSSDSGTGTTGSPNTTGGSSGTTTGTGGANSTSDATRKFDQAVQVELTAVGCYSGGADGVIGPETDAAIVAFQTASGLTPDGKLGPQTDAALVKAVQAGTKVCGAGTTTTSAAAASTTTTAASGPSCTATAIIAASPNPSATLTTYVCASGYAAGIATVNGAPLGFILKANGNTWTDLAQQPCGAASAGLPPAILQDGCVGAGGTSSSSTASTAASSTTSTTS